MPWRRLNTGLGKARGQRIEGQGGGQLVDVPNQVSRARYGWGGRSGKDRGRIGALEAISDQAHASGDGVGDDQIIAGERALIGNGQGIGNQVIRADKTALLTSG